MSTTTEMQNALVTTEAGERELHYWSVYRQQWDTASAVEDVSDEEWAAMPRREREVGISWLDHGVDDGSAVHEAIVGVES
jgi:hypothetical protein